MAAFVRLFEVPLENRPPSFFAKHVQNLFINHDVPDNFVYRILSVCTGLRSFACQNESGVSVDMTRNHLRSTLQHLTLKRSELYDIWKAGVSFSVLQELDINTTTDHDLCGEFEWPHLLKD